MVVAFGEGFGRGFRRGWRGLIDGVGVERDVFDDVVEEEGFEVFQAIGAEEEGGDLGAEFGEGAVAGREDGAAGVGASVGEVETGLVEREFEGGELGG